MAFRCALRASRPFAAVNVCQGISPAALKRHGAPRSRGVASTTQWSTDYVARLFSSSEVIGCRGAPSGTLCFESFRNLAACRTFTEAELLYAFEEADRDGNKLLGVKEVERVVEQMQRDRNIQDSADAASGSNAFMRQAAAFRSGMARTARQCRLATQLILAPAREWEERHAHLVKQATVDLGKTIPFVSMALFLPGGSLALPVVASLFPAAVPSNFRALVLGRKSQTAARELAREHDEFDKLTTGVFYLVLSRMAGSSLLRSDAGLAPAGAADGAVEGAQ